MISRSTYLSSPPCHTSSRCVNWNLVFVNWECRYVTYKSWRKGVLLPFFLPSHSSIPLANKYERSSFFSLSSILRTNSPSSLFSSFLLPTLPNCIYSERVSFFPSSFIFRSTSLCMSSKQKKRLALGEQWQSPLCVVLLWQGRKKYMRMSLGKQWHPPLLSLLFLW